jgi:hypothetical protein
MKTVRDNMRASRLRMPVLIGVGVLIVLLLSANAIARTYTDYLWFENVGFSGVWTTILGTKIVLAVVFTTIFFLILWGNLVVADRLAPSFRPASPEEDLIERYHQIVGGQAGKLRLGLAAVFAVIAGANTASQWQQWLLFRNGGSFGLEDPLFGRDAGFYVFALPFLSFVVDWLFAALVLTIIVVAVAHYLNGGIRASVPAERVTSGVKLHLSVLLAALAVVRAVGYWFDRFNLLNSTRGAYDGALATDVNIQLPAYNLLALISLFGAALFMINIRRQGWGLPLVAIGLWAVSHLFVGSIFPALYQRLRIEPERSTRQAEFVSHNIAATRFAYGLDDNRLTVEEFTYEAGITEEDLVEYSDVLDNVPLIDPELAVESFTRIQGERAFYSFSDRLDVDRYMVDGELRPVALSVRGLDLTVNEVPQSWESQHVLFTHGYGAAVAAGWEVDANGRPRFLVGELGDVEIDDGMIETLGQPRVYFGEGFGGYAIINAERDEVDFQTSSNESRAFRYEGEGGVPIGSFPRRLAFALRFRELDPLIAPAISSDSRVIYNRDVADRVQQVAPFLRFDSNPYPVLANDRLFWVVDGYTTTNTYPYAQTVATDSNLSGDFNYVRNSVKAVVDAYDGTIELYVVDETDPVLEAWVQAFPDLFVDDASMPESIRDNLRYPEDLFRVQTDMWSTYVISDPTLLIQGDTAWSVAAQPRTEAQVGEGDATATVGTSMDPQYLIAQLPGMAEPEFVLQRAFVPRSGEAGSSTARPELTGVMVARSDPGNYGELVLYRVPGGQVEAPDFVHSEIRKNDDLTEFVKEKIGSVVSFGEMTLLLIDDTILYVRPVYVEAASRTAVPELSRVIAANGNRIAMGATLSEAVAELVTGEPSTEADVPDPGAGDDTGDADVAQDVPVAGSDDEADVAAGDTSGDDTGEPGGEVPVDEVPVDDYDPTGKTVVELLADAEEFLLTADAAELNGEAAEASRLRGNAIEAVLAVQGVLGNPSSAGAASTGVPTAGA